MYKPRYYQTEAVDAFFNYVGDNWGKHPLIVLPTAAGKSWVIANIIKKMLEYPNTRILKITHQKELIKQNYEKIVMLIDDPLIDIGIYSAGLKSRDTKNRILCCGIQSIYKKAYELGWFDLILVDEVHLISHKNMGMYRKFLDDMHTINEKIVFGGLTATPYRMGHGLLTEGDDKLFSDICYEATIRELMDSNHFRNKDKTQYLCTLISKNAIHKVDLSGIHKRGGEYISGEMEQAYLKGNFVAEAVQELKEYARGRKKGLVFCSGIRHAEEVLKIMHRLQMSAALIHSKQNENVNDQNIHAFKNGDIKYLLNIGKLTTGFDEPAIDCIALLRSTESPGLFYQMCGRGLRLHPSKINCLILDFGTNIERLGPIDRIEIRKKKDGSGSEVTTMPMKECPTCHQLLFIQTMTCPTCGHVFKSDRRKHENTASEEDIISKWKPPETIDVDHVNYFVHKKEGKPNSMKVEYVTTGFQFYAEWVCVEHSGYAKKKAVQWLTKRMKGKLPETVEEAIKFSKYFLQPRQIIVNSNNKYPEITGYLFNKESKLKDPYEEIADEELGKVI